MVENLEETLISIFEKTSFRFQQEEIIKCNLGINNVLVIKSTGSGKSLTFQLPACLHGIYVFVTPLVSLSEDQCTYLTKLQVQCLNTTGSLPVKTTNLISNPLKYWNTVEKLKLIYVCPEKFKNDDFKSFLKVLEKNNLLSRIVIDEGHTLTQWGKTFRKSCFDIINTIINTMELRIPWSIYSATLHYNDCEYVKAHIENEKEFDEFYDLSYRENLKLFCINFDLFKDDNFLTIVKSLLRNLTFLNYYNDTIDNINQQIERIDNLTNLNDHTVKKFQFIYIALKTIFHGKTGVIYAFKKEEAYELEYYLRSKQMYNVSTYTADTPSYEKRYLVDFYYIVL